MSEEIINNLNQNNVQQGGIIHLTSFRPPLKAPVIEGNE